MESKMSFISNFFAYTEADVVKILVAIKTDAAVIEADVSKALKWVAGNAPAIAADIEEVVSVVTQLGVTSNPEVAAAVVAANAAVSALNAFSVSYTSGTGSAQALVNGYIAVKQATASVASASAAAAGAKTSSVATAPTAPAS